MTDINLPSQVIVNYIIPVPLTKYLFLGVAQAVTATGTFLDINGNQLGNGFTFLIPQGSGAASSLATIAGGAIPTNAVACAMLINADVYFSLGNGNGTLTTDFNANYINYPKKLAGDGYLSLGRIF